MKLPVSDKTSNFGVKPHIKKGYYPGKLLSVVEFKDKDGKLKEGTYGHQLIFEFAVYKPDSETDAPVSPMQYLPNPDNLDEKKDVIIPKFVYHEYKDKKTGDLRTAITPNSAITRILESLGWVFSTEDVDPESFIGNWVELNIDDYEAGENEGDEVASSIKGVGKYKGPAVGDDVRNVVKNKPADVRKQVKGSSVTENSVQEKAVQTTASESEIIESPEIEEKKSKIKELELLNKQGFLTKDGLEKATEQINVQIEELRKK